MISLANLQIQLVGHSSQELPKLASALTGEAGYQVNTRLISNGQLDPLYGLSTLPDILILWVGANWQDELQALAKRPATLRPATIVIGPRDDLAVMRTAMHAGARDFLSYPVALHEIQQAVQRIIQEKQAGQGSAHQTIAVINAKGGSGSTVIATNLAHIIATRLEIPVALLDLNIQFGSLALYLDLRPTRDIVEALNAAELLDALALEGYMTKHKSGLNLLAAPLNRLVLPDEISPEHLNRLLEVVHQTYTRIVIDLPHQIDAVSTVALAQSTMVVVVMLQSLASMRDAKRLLEILQREMEITKDRIIVAVNRYHPKHPITLDAIGQTLQQPPFALIPNDYARTEASINQGVPLLDFEPSAAVTRALLRLARQIGGPEEIPVKRGWLGRAIELLASKPA